MNAPKCIRNFVFNLSPRIEFLLVLFLVFGPSIYNSFRLAFAHRGISHSDSSYFTNVAAQLAVLGFLLWIGRIRGWSLRQLGFNPSWRLTVYGILLFVATEVVLVGLNAVILFLVPTSFTHSHVYASHPSIAAILALSIVDPLFEETFVSAYIIERFSKKGALIGVTCSAAVRFLYHTYKGPYALGALLMGLMFGYVFWRYRQLWPLIVAHGLIDFLALLVIAGKL